jgi:crossover junction endodeoxyribonuclease RuvC
MKILGVDPGIYGGLAIVDIVDGVAPQLIDAVDIPIIGTAAKTRVDVLAVRAWIETHGPDHAVIERAGSMPKQGVASTFKYGRATGALDAVVALCNIPCTLVEPPVWKRHHGLYGQDKETSRQRALMLFPSSHALFARKMDHGRAEAALIALTHQRVSALAEKAQPKAPIASATHQELVT